MTLNVNQSLNASANISSVFAGNEPRRVPPRNEVAIALPQGRGIRASNEVISQLDDERRRQTNFGAATNRRSQHAIDAYQSLANAQRRSEVQSMLGVDLYA